MEKVAKLRQIFESREAWRKQERRRGCRKVLESEFPETLKRDTLCSLTEHAGVYGCQDMRQIIFEVTEEIAG